jgi:hypothetical protein
MANPSQVYSRRSPPFVECLELPLPLFAAERLMHRPKLLNSVIKCERRSHNQPLIIGMGG